MLALSEESALVHGNLLDVTIDLLSLALANVVGKSTLAVSGSHNFVRTVGESHLHVAPDLTSAAVFLIAGCNFSNSAVGWHSGSALNGITIFVASHGAIETST